VDTESVDMAVVLSCESAGVCCSICEFDVKNGILERTLHLYQILLQTEKKSYGNF